MLALKAKKNANNSNGAVISMDKSKSVNKIVNVTRNIF